MAEDTQRQLQSPARCGAAARTSQKMVYLPRSLDLTGPLLLGGVPNLPEDFPVHNRQFVGCMRNLSVDGKNVDMAGFIANNGTREGTGGHQGIGATTEASGCISAATQGSLLADPWGAVFFLEMSVSSCGKLLGWNPESRLARCAAPQFLQFGVALALLAQPANLRHT